MRKGILRDLTKFTRKHLCQSLFFNKVAGLRPATLLKKRLWHRYFPVNFAKFLRTAFLQNTSGRLILKAKYLFKYKISNYFHQFTETFFATKIINHAEQKSFPVSFKKIFRTTIFQKVASLQSANLQKITFCRCCEILHVEN